MKSNSAAVLNMLVRVQRFLDQNGDTFSTINQSSYRAVIDGAVKTLSANDVAQTGSKRAAAAQVAKERVLRNALRVNNMRPISTVAAAQLRDAPEFIEFKMPPGQSSSRGLVSAALAMGTAASKYSATFAAAGLPANFLSALTSAADALNDAINSRTITKSALLGATAAIAAEATRGRQAVNVLDSLVEPLLAGDVLLLSQWQSVTRVTGKAQRIGQPSIDASAKGPTPPTVEATPAQSTTDQPSANQATTPQSTVTQPTTATSQPTTPPATA